MAQVPTRRLPQLWGAAWTTYSSARLRGASREAMCRRDSLGRRRTTCGCRQGLCLDFERAEQTAELWRHHATAGLKPVLIFGGLRGAEAPLFRGTARICTVSEP